MKSIELSLEEIYGLHSFVEDVSAIPMVECVYIVPFFSEALNKPQISVITIRTENFKYNSKLAALGYERNVDEEYEQVRAVVDDYQQEFGDGRLRFCIESGFDYTFSEFSDFIGLYGRLLASGIILFDRFGEKEQKQEEALENLKMFPNAVNISNFYQYESVGMSK